MKLSSQGQHRRQRRNYALQQAVETLEARLMLAVITVTNTSDGGAGSFRQAVIDANGSSVADVINFDTGGVFSQPRVISLLTALPTISAAGGELTITGTGAANLTIRRDPSAGNFRVLDSLAPKLNLNGLRISGGQLSGTADGAGLQAGGTITLDGMVISGNQTDVNGDGGAIRVNSDAFLAVRNSTISGNTGRRGSGIYFYGGGLLLLENSTVSGNSSVGTAVGGGIYFFGTASGSPPAGFTAGTLVVQNSTINSNTTSGAGGAILLQSFTGTLLVQNSTITGNTALTGGGIAQQGSGSGSIVLRNSTVTGNTATGTGPGQGGGGISRTSNVAGTITMVNTVVSANNNSTAPDILTSSPTTTHANYSAIGSNTGFFLSSSSGNNLAFGTPLMLGALGNNGGPTQTMEPQPGSPLIEAGSNAAVPAGMTTDQRGLGFARINGTVDIGAVETQAGGTPVATATAANVTTVGGTSHTFTVAYSDPTGTNNGINVSTIVGNNAAVRVVGPNGFDAPATFVSIDNSTNGTPRTATYSFTAPGGTWDAADNGNYSILIQANQVRDVDGNAVPASTAGSFTVTLPRFITVLNANDSGAGSLRDAIIQSNSFPTNDIIDFDATFFSAPRTITLLSILPEVSAAGGNFILRGPGSNNVVVQIGASAVIPRALTFDTPQVDISGITFKGTGAPGSGGGLQFNAVGGNVVLNDLKVLDNFSPAPGAALHLNTNSILTLRNSVLSGNTTGNSGGGIYFYQNGSLTIENTTITGNRAMGNNGGGGIYFFGSAIAPQLAGVTLQSLTLVIRNSTIDHNEGGGTGGAVSLMEFDGTLLVENSTMVANTAGTSGGAIAMSGGNGSITVANSTITQNAANGTQEGYGGGGISRVGGPGFITVANSIISGNMGMKPDIHALAGVTTNVNYSAIGSNDGFVMSSSSGNNLPFGANLQLGGLANYGGFTQTMRPELGSPLINGGSNALAPVASYDQRGLGFARISDGIVDIGAVEVDSTPPSVQQLKFESEQSPQRVEIKFDAWVGMSLADFVLELFEQAPPGIAGALTPASVVPADKMAVSFNADTNTATIIFPGYANGVLPDGDYRITLLAGGINDASGNALAQNYAATFFFLTGDLNLDRQVSIADFITLASNFGKTGAVYSDGDLNYDGLVSISDFIDLASKFGVTLGPPPVAQAPAAEEIVTASSTSEVAAVLDADQRNERKGAKKRHDALSSVRQDRHHRRRTALRRAGRR